MGLWMVNISSLWCEAGRHPSSALFKWVWSALCSWWGRRRLEVYEAWGLIYWRRGMHSAPPPSKTPARTHEEREPLCYIASYLWGKDDVTLKILRCCYRNCTYCRDAAFSISDVYQIMSFMREEFEFKIQIENGHGHVFHSSSKLGSHPNTTSR